MFVHLVYSVEGWELVRAVAQWQGTGMVNQRPWVRLAAAPPFFPALSPFLTVHGLQWHMIGSLIRPGQSVLRQMLWELRPSDSYNFAQFLL